MSMKKSNNTLRAMFELLHNRLKVEHNSPMPTTVHTNTVLLLVSIHDTCIYMKKSLQCIIIFMHFDRSPTAGLEGSMV